jgi:hypothetical protein
MRKGNQHMNDTAPAPQDKDQALLADWMTRPDLAAALGITADTLSRWEARQFGPPCTRIGRKVLYRRASVESWINAQEQMRPAKSHRGRR